MNPGKGKMGTVSFREISFRPLRVEDGEWIRRCTARSGWPFTALTYPSLMAWAESYGLTIGGDEDFFVVRSRYDKGYYAPCGEAEKCLAFMEAAAEREQPVRFVYVAEETARKLAERGWNMLFRPDLSEYILSSDALALEPGRVISHSYKDKCRHFARVCPYRAREAGPGDTEALRRIAETSANPVVQTGSGDEPALAYELAHMEELGLRGMLVETEAGGGAFLLGYESRPDCFTITMFRRSAGLSRDVLAVCLHEFGKLLRGRYPRVNIEEDLGLEGIRTEKMLCSPVDLLKVYEVVR